MEHPKYVSRAGWGARPPKSVNPMRTPTKVYLHHTAGNESGSAGMRSIQNFHMKPKVEGGKGMQDIAYSWVFDDDGIIYQGRGWAVTHGGNYGADNSTSHSFCFMGNFNNEQPTSAALASFTRMAQYGKSVGHLTGELFGHKDEVGASTACPGAHLYAKVPSLKIAINKTPTPTPTPIVLDEEDSMFLYSTPGEPVFFCDAGVSVGINEASDMDTFNLQKVKHFKLDNDTFLKFRARYPGA